MIRRCCVDPRSAGINGSVRREQIRVVQRVQPGGIHGLPEDSFLRVTFEKPDTEIPGKVDPLGPACPACQFPG